MSRRLASLDDALQTVAALGPLVRERAPSSQSLRTLDAEVVGAFAASGLWGAFTPVEDAGSGLGGLTEQYEVIRAMAYEDGSTGWVLFISGVTPAVVAPRLPAEGRHEIFGTGAAQPMAGVFMPSGRGIETAEGIVVDGRWQFGSGIRHSPWVMANVLMIDERGAPRGTADGIDVRAFVVPCEQVTIVDDWKVCGLEGTGSSSFTVENVTVPAHRTFPFFTARPIAADPRYRLPLFTAVAPAFPAVALGIAQRMLDEVITTLPSRLRPPTYQPASEHPAVRTELGHAIATLAAVDAATRHILARYDDRVRAGEDLTDLPRSERAAVHQQAVWAAETCIATANFLIRLAGANAIYESHLVQRCWRDLTAMGQHHYVGPTTYETAAALVLGHDLFAPTL
jgi:indole-3-acetate monooxygenase